VQPYSITGFVQIDVDATPGPLDVMSGPAGKVIDSAAGTMNIGTRTATALTSGTAANGMIMAVNDSGLYSLDASGSPSLVHLSLSTSSQDGNPVAAILDSSGHWSNQIGGNFAVLPSAGKVYIVVFDGGSAANYSYSLTAGGEMLTQHAEGTDTSTSIATGYDATTTVPFSFSAATISAAGDHDFIKFTVDAAHAGKHLHVITNAGTDALTDTAVNVTGVAGSPSYTNGVVDDNTGCSFFGCSNGGEDIVTAALPMGNYAIDITDGGFYDPADKGYVLVMWFE